MMGHILMTIGDIFQTVFFVAINLAFVFYFHRLIFHPDAYKKKD